MLSCYAGAHAAAAFVTYVAAMLPRPMLLLLLRLCFTRRFASADALCCADMLLPYDLFVALLARLLLWLR